MIAPMFHQTTTSGAHLPAHWQLWGAKDQRRHIIIIIIVIIITIIVTINNMIYQHHNDLFSGEGEEGELTGWAESRRVWLGGLVMIATNFSLGSFSGISSF